MKKIAILCTFLSMAFSSAAQVKSFDICGPEDIFRYTKGDTVIILCDSAYTMTPARYLGYELMRYTLLKNNNLLFGTITQLKQNYENNIEQLNKAYEDMRALYVKCDESSSGYLKKIDLSVDKSLSEIHDANIKIDSTRDLINQTRDIIKKDIRKQFGSKLLWGAGGVVVGLSVSTALILLVSK